MCGSSKKIKETPEERELAKISKERWDRYKEKFIPVENKAIQQTIKDLDTPSNQGPSLANLATQSQFSKLEGQVNKGLTLRGARLGSGAMTSSLAGLNIDRAASSAGGQVGALGLQRSQSIANLQSLINMGGGYGSEGLTGLSTVADAAARQSFLDAQASAASRAALGNAVGTGVGMYAGSMYGGGYNQPVSTPPTAQPTPTSTYNTPTTRMLGMGPT